jgi:hypothetical protein
MTENITFTLPGFILPPDSPVARRHVRPEGRRSDEYLRNYDTHTLFYDCVYLRDRRAFMFTAPRFFNLWRTFRAALRLDGEPARGLARYRFPKFEQVLLRGPADARLSLELEGAVHPIVARPEISGRFAGLNAAVTMNKDNDPGWIEDWARYLVRVHGLQALVIYDNGSTSYSVDELSRRLADRVELQQLCVVSAPFPYGSNQQGRGWEIRPKFLQPALLNLARTEILRRARAVLNVDIDEVVMSRSGASVFDLSAAHPNLPVKLPGQWAFPSPQTEGAVGHAAHVWRSVPPRRSNKKWCAVPGGLLSRMGWYVHHIGGELFRLSPAPEGMEVIHCRATSTGWKSSKNRFNLPDRLERDPELETFMAEHFPSHPGE